MHKKRRLTPTNIQKMFALKTRTDIKKVYYLVHEKEGHKVYFTQATIQELHELGELRLTTYFK